MANVKINSFNRRLAREVFYFVVQVAECWFPVESKNSHYGFDSKFKLRVALFSPLLGDELYPLFRRTDDMVITARSTGNTPLPGVQPTLKPGQPIHT